MLRDRQQAVFKLFSITLILALLLPELLQYGMFMDGMQYGCVGRNLAEGRGSFWLPYLSSSWSRMELTAFLEQPPLSYFLQAGFFKVFGNAFYVERLYGLAAALLCAFLIYKVWDLLFQQDPVLKPYWWLAVLFWFITPSVFWSFQNNMIENTVSVFVLGATYFALKAMLVERLSLFHLLLAAIFVFLGSLTKGIPAFFPVTLLACFYLFSKRAALNKSLLYSLLLVAVCALIYGLLYSCNADARFSLVFYIKSRLLERISNDPTVDNRFSVLFWLFTDLLVALVLVALLLLAFRPRTFTRPLSRPDRLMILFFFAYGLCGVAPLCLTKVQRAVYFVPALPFFAMGLAVFTARGLDTLINRIGEKAVKIMRYSTYALIAGVLIYSAAAAGGASRDASLLSDARKIGGFIGKDKVIGSPLEVYSKWNFQFYLLRYHYDVLALSQSWNEPYLLFEKEYDPARIPAAYKKAELSLANYVLFVKD